MCLRFTSGLDNWHDLQLTRSPEPVLVCSKDSLARGGVLNEIEEALRRGAKLKGEMLVIPIDLDGYIFSGWNPPRSGDCEGAAGARGGRLRGRRHRCDEVQHRPAAAHRGAEEVAERHQRRRPAPTCHTQTAHYLTGSNATPALKRSSSGSRHGRCNHG